MDFHSISMEEKIGQLFIVGFNGPQLRGETIHLIATYHIGGLLLQDENVRSPKQVHRLIHEAQRYANKKLPLFSVMKQAGGKTNTIQQGVIQTPSYKALGKINNRLYTKQIASHMAVELNAMGINMNIVPHLHVNKESTFSNHTDLVAKHGVAMIQGFQKQNILTVANPFPSLDEIKKDRSVLDPYVKAIQNGVDAIMVNDHSHSIIQLLREELGFHSIIMCQYPINKKYPQFAIDAFKNGIDIIILPKSYKQQIQIMNTMTEAVSKGEISEARLDEAVERIISMKEKKEIGQLDSFDREKFLKKRAVTFSKKLLELANKNME